MKIVPTPRQVTLYEAKCFFSDDLYSEKLVPTLEEEEYVLEATFSGITLRAGGQAGLFYGRQTLEQVKAQYGTTFPSFRVEDKPEYKYRSFSVDCSRHFFSVEELKKVIDSMSLLKFNTFHWHLTDDQGWRVECEKYPELHEKASQRMGEKLDGTGVKPYGNYYTKAQLKEIVAYCNHRFITVVPEFDVPGHCSALLSVLPRLSCTGKPVKVKNSIGVFQSVLCPGKSEVYTVLEDIFTELFDIFPGEYYHIGGDEAPTAHWKTCPHCRETMRANGITDLKDYHVYFLNKIANFLMSNGKTPVVWNDGLSHKPLAKGVVVQHWKEGKVGNGVTTKLANAGAKVVLSPCSSYYTDLPYGVTSLRKALSYKATVKGFDLRGRENVLGVEACSWSEFIPDGITLQQMLFPRSFAVAQTGWSGAGKVSYRQFVTSLDPVLEILGSRGISVTSKLKWSLTPVSRLVDSVNHLRKNRVLASLRLTKRRNKEN